MHRNQDMYFACKLLMQELQYIVSHSACCWLRLTDEDSCLGACRMVAGSTHNFS